MLASHRPYDLKINLEEGSTPPLGQMYSLSQTELVALREFIDEHLAALSVKYTDIARDNEDDKTPELSVQRIFAGLYSSMEKVHSANEYCTTNDVWWAHVSSIMRCRGGPVD